MQKEDIFYLFILIFSIPLGHLLKVAPNYGNKKLISLIAGLSLVLVMCGRDIVHTLVVIIGNYLLVKVLGTQQSRWVSFVYVFSYLFVMRMLIFYRYLAPGKYTNAVQLMVTLRMVSLPFELYRTNNNEEGDCRDDEKKVDETSAQSDDVSLYTFLAYGYCYIGLMTGPFYTFKSYKDMLITDHRKTDTFVPALKNLKSLPFFLLSYVVLSKYFPIQYLQSDDYLNHPFGIAYQLLMLVPTFTQFRWRFYIAWLFSEAACMAAGLGAYPVESEAKPGGGPTKEISSKTGSDGDVEYGFETIHNINIMGIEVAPTMTVAMKQWNMTVQWWMATYVYKELPFRSRQVRMFALLFVSAFWHGVHPGYYFTFLSVPCVVIAEKRMVKSLTPYLDEKGRYYFDWVTHFCLYRSFEYLGVGFMLLDLRTIWKVWSKMYFIGHIFILIFILLPIVIPRKRPVSNGDFSKTD